MEQYAYLSPEWLEAVREVRSRYAGSHEPLPPLIVNYTISDIPGYDGAAEFHSDARSRLYFERGHRPDAAWSISTDYTTAREVYRDTSLGMNQLTDAYEAGTLTVEGDLEAIREAFADAVRAVGYLEVLDEIAAFTA
jgi:hypothetical protein